MSSALHPTKVIFGVYVFGLPLPTSGLIVGPKRAGFESEMANLHMEILGYFGG